MKLGDAGTIDRLDLGFLYKITKIIKKDGQKK